MHTTMPLPRGRSHTTLTATAALVVAELEKYPSIKMIAPGIISGKRAASQKHVTAVFTTAGMELIISGEGTQKVAIHTKGDARPLFEQLQAAKKLQRFTFNSRERRPGI